MGKRVAKPGQLLGGSGQVNLEYFNDPMNFGKLKNTPIAQVMAEAHSSAVSRTLTWLDPCFKLWLPIEQDKVAANTGYATGAIPTVLLLSALNILENAAVKPLQRIVGYKGMRCKKQNKKVDPEEDEDLYEDLDEEDEYDDACDMVDKKMGNYVKCR